MKIVSTSLKGVKIRVRSDLARLSSKNTQKFINYGVVSDYLAGKTTLDCATAKIILNADKSLLYIEKFVNNKISIKKTDHIIALLCIFSDDSFGARILSEDYYDYAEELQERLDECAEHDYHGIRSAVSVMDFLSFSDFLHDKTYDVWFLLYNLFLYKEGVCLILEDTDTPDSSLLLGMKYKVENYVSKLKS